MSSRVTIIMDEQELTAESGQTILDVAWASGIDIPRLCYFKGLTSVGACRLCLVEVRGVPRLLAACVARVAEGMVIQTNTPKLRSYRKMILELLLAERNHICAFCVASGHCELQDLAQALGVTHVRYPYRFSRHDVDASHERFVHDPNRCVLCTRCLRVCEEVEGAQTWNVRGRGIQSAMITDLNQRWGESPTCTSCGKCIQACPTGALTIKGRATGEMQRAGNLLVGLSGMRSSGR